MMNVAGDNTCNGDKNGFYQVSHVILKEDLEQRGIYCLWHNYEGKNISKNDLPAGSLYIFHLTFLSCKVSSEAMSKGRDVAEKELLYFWSHKKT
jgi:hypothetical protein